MRVGCGVGARDKGEAGRREPCAAGASRANTQGRRDLTPAGRGDDARLHRREGWGTLGPARRHAKGQAKSQEEFKKGSRNSSKRRGNDYPLTGDGACSSGMRAASDASAINAVAGLRGRSALSWDIKLSGSSSMAWPRSALSTGNSAL